MEERLDYYPFRLLLSNYFFLYGLMMISFGLFSIFLIELYTTTYYPAYVYLIFFNTFVLPLIVLYIVYKKIEKKKKTIIINEEGIHLPRKFNPSYIDKTSIKKIENHIFYDNIIITPMGAIIELLIETLRFILRIEKKKKAIIIKTNQTSRDIEISRRNIDIQKFISSLKDLGYENLIEEIV